MMSARQLGTIGMVGALVWVLAVIALHFLGADLDPMDTYVSDYALGDYGWLMRAAFIAVGVGTIAIGWGLRQTLSPGKRVTASWVLVVVAGVGFVLAGLFNTDPTGATDITTAGAIHVASALILFLSLVVSSWMLRGVFSRDQAWQSATIPTLVFAVALTATFLVSFLTGDDGPVGLTQRIFAGVIMIWLFFLGRTLRSKDSIQPVT